MLIVIRYFSFANAGKDFVFLEVEYSLEVFLASLYLDIPSLAEICLQSLAANAFAIDSLQEIPLPITSHILQRLSPLGLWYLSSLLQPSQSAALEVSAKWKSLFYSNPQFFNHFEETHFTCPKLALINESLSKYCGSPNSQSLIPTEKILSLLKYDVQIYTINQVILDLVFINNLAVKGIFSHIKIDKLIVNTESLNCLSAIGKIDFKYVHCIGISEVPTKMLRPVLMSMTSLKSSSLSLVGITLDPTISSVLSKYSELVQLKCLNFTDCIITSEFAGSWKPSRSVCKLSLVNCESMALDHDIGTLISPWLDRSPQVDSVCFERINFGVLGGLNCIRSLKFITDLTFQDISLGSLQVKSLVALAPQIQSLSLVRCTLHGKDLKTILAAKYSDNFKKLKIIQKFPGEGLAWIDGGYPIKCSEIELESLCSDSSEGDKLCQYIGESLKETASITKICLGSNYISWKGFCSLFKSAVESINRSPRNIFLDVRNNHMRNTAKIMKCLRNNNFRIDGGFKLCLDIRKSSFDIKLDELTKCKKRGDSVLILDNRIVEI